MAKIDDLRHGIKKFVDKIESDPEAEFRSSDLEHARIAKSVLDASVTESFTTDQKALVANIVGVLCAQLTTMTIRDLAETLDNSVIAYSLVCADLLGIYSLAEKPKAEDPGGCYI